MKPKILIVDDFEEIRELICFMLESQMEVEVLQDQCGKDAIQTLQKHPDIQLVISDMIMPNGSGEDIYRFIHSENRNLPMAFLTGDDLSSHAFLKGAHRIEKIPKPFTDEQILNVVKKLLPAEETGPLTQYIPVRLELLKKIHEIKTPLFVKINDHKYVRVTQDHSEFSAEMAKKYQMKSVDHLYVEFIRAEEFIAEYKKKAMADLAWEQAGEDKTGETVKLNTELLRDLSHLLGWSGDLIELAQSHFQKALKIASSNPDLHLVFHHFHKIERYGYADHCTLLFLVAAKLAYDLEMATENNLRRLTFASLFHDMSLTDDLYEHKEKYLRIIERQEPNPNHDTKEIIAHPTRAAELCRRWDFCPAVVDTIIFQHHERPDGHGFPMGKRANELHPLSCLFILCEDFVTYFIDTYGEPDLVKYIDSRKKMFSEGQFKPFFEALSSTMRQSIKEAS